MTTAAAAARVGLHDRLAVIARNADADGLKNLLAGAGLPALGSGDEPGEQIHAAMLASDYGGLARRIGQLLAHLIQHRAESLAQSLAKLEGIALGNSDTTVPATDQLLDDEGYVFNLFLLATVLPREQGIFTGLLEFHRIGLNWPVLVANHARAAQQLRRALIEQQHDDTLKDYWLELLRDKQRTWNAARRTELLDAWSGWIALLDMTRDATRADIDQGLRVLHDTVEPRVEGLGMLELAFWRLDTAFPLDPLTWKLRLEAYWPHWPALLRDIAVQTWPALAPEALDDIPPLPETLAPLWQALKSTDRERLRAGFRTHDGAQGHQTIQALMFTPPAVAGMAPQEVRARLGQLEKHLWPQHIPMSKGIAVQTEPDDENDRSSVTDIDKRASFDRLAALQAVNRTLTEIERRLQRGDADMARRFLAELLDRQRQQPIANRHLHLAKTLAKAATLARDQGLLDWAESLWREACDENPNDEVAASGLADVLKTRGRLDDAETQYRRNIARWPNNEVAASGLADVLKAQGRLDDAEAQYRQNIARWPNNEVAASGLADVLKAQGRLDDAEAQYRRNIASWPNGEVAASGLADVLKTQGRLDDAEAQYRRNIARWPNGEVAANGLADVLKAQDRLDDAEAQYRRNIARWPNNEVAASGLADVLKAQGRLDDAEEQYRKNIALWPNDEVAANGLADVLKAQGRLDDAEAQYRRNIAHWPNDEVAASGLADVLKAQGRLDDAEAQYRWNIARWPNDEVAADGLADVLKAQGRLDDAEAQYRRNIARWPNDEVAANGLADVLKAQGRLDDAEAQYRRNVARWPNNRVAKNGLANVLRKQHRHPEALSLLANPDESAPIGYLDYYDLHLRGLILSELGRLEDARAVLNRGARAAIGTAHRAHFQRGLIFIEIRAEHYAEAREALLALNDKVTSLSVYRLHVEASLGRTDDARHLLQDMETRQDRFDMYSRRALEQIRAGFGLGSAETFHQPDTDARARIFDAEIEMELAAA